MSDKKFSGKVAVITGATSGIGHACAIAFANEGANVVCIGRKEDVLNEVAQEIRDAGAEALPVRADLSDEREADRAIDEALKAFGGVDVLVNAAGFLTTGTIETTSQQAWDEMMNVNVRAVFRLMQKALPSLIDRRGNIVNVSSVTGLRSFPGVDRKSTRLNSSHSQISYAVFC